MALTVKRITLWRREVENQPGVLAGTLEPLAAAGASFRVVMGYRFPEARERAAIELFPVAGTRATRAAEAAGLAPYNLPVLLVEGDDRPGLGAGVGRALADAGLNVVFLVAQVVGRRFAAVIGLEDEPATAAATTALRGFGRQPKPRSRTPARKKRR
jgi:hypothetical protein